MSSYRLSHKRSIPDHRDRKPFSKRPRLNTPNIIDVLPVFKSSGILEAENKNIRRVGTKHVEPSDAAAPNKNANHSLVGATIYKLYIYEKDRTEPIEVVDLGERSCYLIGRAQVSQDLPRDPEEPSLDIALPEDLASSEHCVIQFRKSSQGHIKPYIMDLNSTNETFLNNKSIPSSRYVELKHLDSVRLGAANGEANYEMIFVADNL